MVQKERFEVHFSAILASSTHLVRFLQPKSVAA
jgi:hypothetical protein